MLRVMSTLRDLFFCLLLLYSSSVYAGLDQAHEISSLNISGYFSQSFTVGTSGNLTGFDVKSSATDNRQVTFKLYAGETVAGSPLHTTTVTVNPGWSHISLPNIPVTVGEKYTIFNDFSGGQFRAFEGDYHSFHSDGTDFDAYPGGGKVNYNGVDAFFDYCFRTYVDASSSTICPIAPSYAHQPHIYTNNTIGYNITKVSIKAEGFSKLNGFTSFSKKIRIDANISDAEIIGISNVLNPCLTVSYNGNDVDFNWWFPAPCGELIEDEDVLFDITIQFKTSGTYKLLDIQNGPQELSTIFSQCEDGSYEVATSYSYVKARVLSIAPNPWKTEQETYLEELSLKNYPNPFAEQTLIEYTLPEKSEVNLTVFDMTGKVVARIIEGESQLAGLHQAVFNGTALTNGTYFYILQTDKEQITKKFTLIK